MPVSIPCPPCLGLRAYLYQHRRGLALSNPHPPLSSSSLLDPFVKFCSRGSQSNTIGPDAVTTVGLHSALYRLPDRGAMAASSAASIVDPTKSLNYPVVLSDALMQGKSSGKEVFTGVRCKLLPAPLQFPQPYQL